MPTDFRREDPSRRLPKRRDAPRSHHHGREPDVVLLRSGIDVKRHGRGLPPPSMARKVSRSRSRSPLLRLHHERNRKEAEERERGFYESYNREREHEHHHQHLHSRERKRASPVIKSHIVQGPPISSRPSNRLRMDEPIRRSRSHERRDHGHHRHETHGHDRHMSAGTKRNSNFDSSSVFGDLDRAVKRAREHKILEAEDKWGHSGYKELYHSDKHGNRQKSRPDIRRSRSRSRSPLPPPRRAEEPRGHRRSRSPPPRKLLPPRRSRSPTPPRNSGGLKSIVAPQRPNPPKGKSSSDKWTTKQQHHDDSWSRQGHAVGSSEGHSKRSQEPSRGNQARSHIASEIGNRKVVGEKSSATGGRSEGGSHSRQIPKMAQTQKSSSRPNSSKGSRQGEQRKMERRNSSSSEFSSRTPSPQLKKKTDVKTQHKQPVTTKGRSSSSGSSSDEDVLEIHARDRQQSLSSGSSSSSDEGDSLSDESVRKGDGSRSRSSSSFSDDRRTPKDANQKNPERQSAESKKSDKETAVPKNTPDKNSTAANNGTAVSKGDSMVAKGPSPTPRSKATAATKASASESESESSSESEEEPRMTLSERFAKLTQMSRDKREFAKPEIAISEIDTKLKVVKDLRSADTKVYVNQPSSRPTSARSRPKSPDFNLKEGEMKYTSDDRRRHFERMSRDEPMDRDRPDDWSDVRVRFSYYQSRGYFDERPLTLEEYGKWEAWWYEYRDWLAQEGYYDNQQAPPNEYREGVAEGGRSGGGSNRRDSKNWRPRTEQPPPSFNGSEQRRQQRPSFDLHAQPEPLLAHPIRINDRRYPAGENQNRIPVSRRIGHAPGGSLLVNVQPRSSGGFRGRGRLAGRLGFRR